MKNDLENEKQPVNEEKTNNSLQPEIAEKESAVELHPSETSLDEKPVAEKEVKVYIAEEKALEETPEEATVEIPEETPLEAPTEVPVETPIEIPAETPEKSPVEIPTVSPVEAPEEAVEVTSAEVLAEATVETPEEIAVESPVETVEVSEETLVEDPEEAPEVTPVEAPEEAPAETPEVIAVESPVETVEVAEETLVEAPVEIPAKALEEVPEVTPVEIPVVIPAETPDDIEEEIDYHLEDGHEEEVAGDEEEDGDENAASESEEAVAALLSIDEIVLNLRKLVSSENPRRKDVDEFKNQFYRSLRNEVEGQKQHFLSGGGEEIDFIANEPEIFIEGKELLQQIKEKRATILAKEEAEKEKNVARKLAIIEQIKLLTESQGQGQEDFNKSYQEFKTLQLEWNDIKLVPQAKVNELWKSYQRYVEIFYDLVRINNEFREYDFKKNLELKTDLCEAAERLNDESEVVSAFHQLQNLHQEWREIGPVSRKDREEIWNRFKEASTSVNKKYQTHFEELRGKEDENLELKTALCEKLEAINYTEIKTIKEWNSKVKEVLGIQTEWRQIGYVPRKWNTKIYKRYRAACDLFFKTKNDFYKSLRGEMEENLRRKIALCVRAEEIMNSQDWKKSTQDMIDIQKEWKNIGIVPHKYVDTIWKRFISACDYFFEQKKVHTSSQYVEESKNLEAKKVIVDKINQLDTKLGVDEALALLHELMDEWYEIGHVPYKMKDRVYKEFYDATEVQFDRLNIDKGDRKLESFKTNITDMAKSGNAKNQLLREREKLMRQYERMKNELQTYENNIGFLSVSSKKGNHLLDDMNQKMEKIKAELQLIVKKVEAIDREL